MKNSVPLSRRTRSRGITGLLCLLARNILGKSRRRYVISCNVQQAANFCYTLRSCCCAVHASLQSFSASGRTASDVTDPPNVFTLVHTRLMMCRLVIKYTHAVSSTTLPGVLASHRPAIRHTIGPVTSYHKCSECRSLPNGNGGPDFDLSDVPMEDVEVSTCALCTAWSPCNMKFAVLCQPETPLWCSFAAGF